MRTGDDDNHDTENGYNESFNGRLRNECLKVELFSNVMEAKIIIEM